MACVLWKKNSSYRTDITIASYSYLILDGYVAESSGRWKSRRCVAAIFGRIPSCARRPYLLDKGMMTCTDPKTISIRYDDI